MSKEIEEREPIISATHQARFFAAASVLLSFVTVVAVVIVTILVPSNPAIVATIIGITAPITMGLLGASMRGLSLGVDGQFNRLTALVAAKERSEGFMDGVIKAKTGEIP